MAIARYPTEINDETPLQDVLTWRIHIVHSKLNVQASKFLEVVSGIPLAYWRILLAISQDGVSTHSAIRRKIMMDKGQLSRSLKAMVEDGLVKANDDKDDQRQQQISLTAKGRGVFRKTLPKMRLRQNFLVGQLSKTERKAIFSALEKLERAAQAVEFA